MFCVKDHSEHSDLTKTRIDSLSFCDSDRNLQQQTSAADWMWKNQRFCIFLILGNVELTWKHQIRTRTIAVDPHSVFADPDSALVLNADPDPAAFFMHCKKSPYEEFSGVEKTQKIAQK